MSTIGEDSVLARDVFQAGYWIEAFEELRAPGRGEDFGGARFREAIGLTLKKIDFCDELHAE